MLDPPEITQANPCWVVGAAKEVIDGHGSIWQPSFLLFIKSLLSQHVRGSKPGTGAAAPIAPATPGGGVAALGNLSAFAKSIRPTKLPQR